MNFYVLLIDINIINYYNFCIFDMYIDMQHVLCASVVLPTGKSILIPRLPIIPSDLLFQFRHIQFLYKLASAIIINKARGQTLNVAGIDLSVVFLAIIY